MTPMYFDGIRARNSFTRRVDWQLLVTWIGVALICAFVIACACYGIDCAVDTWKWWRMR